MGRSYSLLCVVAAAGAGLALFCAAPIASAALDGEQAGPLSLRLRGFYRNAPSGAVEWFGGAELVVAWDALTPSPAQETLSVPELSASPPLSASPVLSDVSALSHDVDEPGRDETFTVPAPAGPQNKKTNRRETADEQEAEVDAAQGEQAPPSAPSADSNVVEEKPRVLVTPAFARQAVRATLAALGQVPTERRLASLVSRAQYSALLPQLRVRVGRNLDQTLRYAPTVDDPYSYTSTGGADWRIEGRVTWELSRLIYVKEELAVERLRREDAALGFKRVKQTLARLLDWQRAALAETDAALAPEEQLAAMLRRLEAELALDVLTAGWFSRKIAAKQAKRPPAQETENEAGRRGP